MYESTIENHLIDTLEANMTATVDRYYGAVNEIDLVEFVHSKVQAGKNGVFVRCEEVQPESMDTLGLMYRTRYQLEVMVVTNTVKLKHLNQERDTYAVGKEVLKIALKNPVTIDGTLRGFYWSGTRSMFRGKDNQEIMVVRMEVPGVVVDIDNS